MHLPGGTPVHEPASQQTVAGQLIGGQSIAQLPAGPHWTGPEQLMLPVQLMAHDPASAHVTAPPHVMLLAQLIAQEAPEHATGAAQALSPQLIVHDPAPPQLIGTVHCIMPHSRTQLTPTGHTRLQVDPPQTKLQEPASHVPPALLHAPHAPAPSPGTSAAASRGASAEVSDASCASDASVSAAPSVGRASNAASVAVSRDVSGSASFASELSGRPPSDAPGPVPS